MAPNRVSIKKVAEEAGVSVATVSYVLNNKASKSISSETTERVLETVKALGYVPNQAARTIGLLRTPGVARSKLFGVLIPQTEPGREFMFGNPFYGEFLSAVEYQARRSGYHLMISGANVEQSYVQVAINRSVDGIIIIGAYPDEGMDEFKTANIPTIMVDCYVDSSYCHSVKTDDRHGSYLATKHLIEKGHQAIAFVSGAIDKEGVNKVRFSGYKKALEEIGIDPPASWVISGNVGFEQGESAAELILSQAPEITAVHATADIIALGLVKGFSRLGLRVPEDISIVGFDDTYLASLCVPSLSTINQNIALKGKTAVETLLDVIENGGSRRAIEIPIALVERGSVRDLKL
jgi:LacI family transcriptional regulator